MWVVPEQRAPAASASTQPAARRRTAITSPQLDDWFQHNDDGIPNFVQSSIQNAHEELLRSGLVDLEINEAASESGMSASKSSMVMTETSRTTIKTTVTAFTNGTPSLTRHSSIDSTSSESSLDTNDANPFTAVQLLETDNDGALQAPVEASPSPIQYCCFFNFLDCHEKFDDKHTWQTHTKAHLLGRNPPKVVHCSLCAFEYRFGDCETAWKARLNHLAGHFEKGENMKRARPDFNLITYMCQQGVLPDWRYKELRGGERPQAVAVLAGSRSERRRETTAQYRSDRRRGE